MPPRALPIAPPTSPPAKSPARSPRLVLRDPDTLFNAVFAVEFIPLVTVPTAFPTALDTVEVATLVAVDVTVFTAAFKLIAGIFKFLN